MDASEAQQARIALELRPVDLATELNTTPDVVSAWEDGRMRVPKHVAEHLRWRTDRLQRAQALEASGLAECSWVREFEKEPVPKKLKARVEHFEKVVTHSASCSVCRAREAYVTERFGPMPPAPRRGWLAVAAPVLEWIGRLPAWVQPAAVVGLLFAAYTFVQVVFRLPVILHNPVEGSLTALGMLALSASIGAMLGFVGGQFLRFRAGRSARHAA